MSSTIASIPDPVSWHDQNNCVYMTIRNFDIGFHKPRGVFGFRPAGVRNVLPEPALYCVVRPWFFKTGIGWNVFNAAWETATSDYAGEAGEPWNESETFGWEHEFDVLDPPAGVDCLVKNYVQLAPNHRQFKFITKVTPYFAIDNIGIEYAWGVKAEYVSQINSVYVEKADGLSVELPLQQVKNIKIDIPDSIMRIGLIYLEQEILFIFDETMRGWEHVEIATEQISILGTDFWVCRIGGANLETPQPVAANEEVVF